MPRKPQYKPPVDAASIGQRLREARKRRGLTQVEVADKLGMKQALISDYELGKLRMHGGILAAFAQVLGVSADELLGLSAPKSNGIFKDRRFLRRLQQIESLPNRKKQALLTTLDQFLKGAGVA